MPLPIDESLRVHLASRSPLLFLVSWEEDRVLQHLNRVSAQYVQQTLVWSVTRGLRSGADALDDKYQGPYAALEYIEANTKPTLFVLLDFHAYLNDSRIVRKLRDLLRPLQASGSAIVIVSPKLVVPLELEKDLIVMDYPLPALHDVERLFESVAHGVASNPKFSIRLAPAERESLMRATLGLTQNEIKNVLAKALVSDSALDLSDIDVVLAEKEQIIRKSGILEVFASPADFGSVAGLDQLKAWLQSREAAFSGRARDFGLPYPKGLLLVGVPGCGKSLVSKAVAAAWRQPLLRLDVGRVFGGLVGSSEENIRRVIQVAEAVAPAVLWIDEIEKGFAGVRNAMDSGTSARVFSTFLTWMHEKSSPVFVVATANDIRGLPPEMLRKGRFDEIFFVDLPRPDEREAILRLHLHRRRRDPDGLRIDVAAVAAAAADFSGAELEEAVVAALFHEFAAGSPLDTGMLMKMVGETYPLARTMPEAIAEMRDWARHRARYASRPAGDRTGAVQPERWDRLGAVALPDA
jgi:SpoVK/Ycf46/Vps4 family AAA+-type ATPase